MRVKRLLEVLKLFVTASLRREMTHVNFESMKPGEYVVVAPRSAACSRRVMKRPDRALVEDPPEPDTPKEEQSTPEPAVEQGRDAHQAST